MSSLLPGGLRAWGGVHDRLWPSLSFRFQVGLLSSAQRGESFSQFLCFFLEEAVPCVAVDSLFAGRGEFRILTAQTALCSVGSHLYLAGR